MIDCVLPLLRYSTKTLTHSKHITIQPLSTTLRRSPPPQATATLENRNSLDLKLGVYTSPLPALDCLLEIELRP